MLARLLRPVARPLLRQSPIASRFAVQQFGFHASGSFSFLPLGFPRLNSLSYVIFLLWTPPARTLSATKAPVAQAEPPVLFSDISALADSATGHKSSAHWSKERLLSISLIPSMFLGIFFDNVVLDLAIGMCNLIIS
jgi:hypothetical protein